MHILVTKQTRGAYLDRFPGRFKVPVVHVCHPGFPAVEIFHPQLVLTVELGEFGFDVCRHEWDDGFGRLWRDEAVFETRM